MSMRRPPVGETTDDFDALVEEWTFDSTAARDRTLGLIRTTHVALGPLVVLGCLLDDRVYTLDSSASGCVPLGWSAPLTGILQSPW